MEVTHNPRDFHMSEDQPRTDERALVYSAQQVRQGDIVLRKPWQRGVFIAGLVGGLVLALALVLIGAYFGRAYSDQQLTSAPALHDTGHS
jgi:hypothetical protein